MKNIIAAISIMFFLCGGAYAQGTGVLIAEGTYLSAYADGGNDAYAVLGKLDPNSLIYASEAAQVNYNAGDILAKTLDGLYQEVSDILDIHIKDFKGTIQVVPDSQSLSDYFKMAYNIDFNELSIYYFQEDIIYVSFADLTVGMLGHEIAHAIISHFFVVPPPAKIQDVLCGYVENALRK